MLKPLKVRWTIDPFHDDLRSWRRVVDISKVLSKKYDITIIPTYVLSKDISGFFSNYINLSQKALKKRIESIAKSRLEGFSIEGLTDTDIHITNHITQRSGAKVFADLVEQDNTGLVIITKSKKNAHGRYVMGSFISSLLSHSNVPILVLPARAKQIKQLDKSFYPTDISIENLKVFKQLMKRKVNFASDYTLYHKLHMSVPQMVYDISGPHPELELNLKKLKAKRLKDLEHLVVYAKSSDVHIKFKIDENSEYLPQVILDYASSEGADYIAIPSFVGKVDSLFIGSATMEVINMSNIPVLVWKEGHV